MNRLSIQQRVQVINALVEGNSIRATCRMTDTAKGTVLRLLAEVGAVCAARRPTRWPALALRFRLLQLRPAVRAVARPHRRQRAAAPRAGRRQPRPALPAVLPVLRVVRLARLALHHEPLHQLQPPQKLLLRRPPLSPPSPRPSFTHVRHPCLTPLPSDGRRSP